MPSATAACDVLLSNEQPEANWAGSVKPLEAMACGVPIVLSKRPSRVDQLGEDYPLYFNNEDDLAQKVVRLYEDKPFYADVQRYLRERSVRFLAKSRATDLEAKFRALLAS